MPSLKGFNSFRRIVFEILMLMSNIITQCGAAVVLMSKKYQAQDSWSLSSKAPKHQPTWRYMTYQRKAELRKFILSRKPMDVTSFLT